MSFLALLAGCSWDPDGVGLDNRQEKLLGTDPDLADTDGEGLSDGLEVSESGTDPLIVDTDEDGVEVEETGTDPRWVGG
ncbi:MAG: hypothetical protein AAF602_21640 [Myxococcota bacterium]